MSRAIPLKYAPLAAYLAQYQGDQVRLTVPELEAILGVPLPRSAWTRPWWKNTRRGSPQGRAWLDAGWKVAVLERRAGPPVVTFARRPPDSTA